MPNRYVSKDMAEANQECLARDSTGKTTCPECRMSVMLHCTSCRIQVTGCLCTEVDRFGQDEAWRRSCERFGEDLARQHYQRAGLYVPKGLK